MLTTDPLFLGLGAIWSSVALVALVRSRRKRAGAWRLVAASGAGLASIAFTRWNVHAWKAAQRALHESGLYDQRVLFKVGCALVLALIALAVGWVLWRRRTQLRGTGLVSCALGGAFAFVGALTLSLDNYMPRMLADPPGRFVVEYGFAFVALAACIFGREADA